MDLFLKGEVHLLYLIGYIIAATKISEGLEGIYLYLAEIFYLDSRIKRIKELRQTKIQSGKEVEFSNFDITFDNVSFSYNGTENKVIDGVSLLQSKMRLLR